MLIHDEPEQRPSSLGLGAAKSVLTIVGLVCVAIGLPSCSNPTKNLEAAIVSKLSPVITVPITAASCPNLEKFEAGKEFDCDVTIADGRFPATVTLKDNDGAFTVNSKNLLVMAALEKQVVDMIKTQNQLDVKVDCGPSKVKLFKTVGETVECKLVTPDGKSGTATATTTDMLGSVNLKANSDK